MGISITWCSALSVWYVRETLTWRQRSELVTQAFGPRYGQNVAAVIAQSMMLMVVCERSPSHLRKQQFWGVCFTPLRSHLQLINVVWCSSFRFRILFCKLLQSEIFTVLLRVITWNNHAFCHLQADVPLVSLIDPNALLYLMGF